MYVPTSWWWHRALYYLYSGHNGRGGSLSSEDNVSRQAHSRESSMDKRNNEFATIHHNFEDDSEDEDDGLVSLDQFLKEIDKSPKTRVNTLISRNNIKNLKKSKKQSPHDLV